MEAKKIINVEKNKYLEEKTRKQTNTVGDEEESRMHMENPGEIPNRDNRDDRDANRERDERECTQAKESWISGQHRPISIYAVLIFT